MTKRLFDMIVAAAGLVVLSPLFAAIALFVKCDDGGPVFYRQIRVGRGGRPFSILKFRSMRTGADKQGPAITKSGDSRVTRIGRFLRNKKLDELPQLINVLWGEMSLVGPRPEVPRYVDLYTDAQRAVLKLRPGITDVASIEFRNEEELLAKAADCEQFYRSYCIPKKIDLNLAYARRANLRSDISVVLQTLSVIRSNRP